MKCLPLLAVAAIAATPGIAEETRQLDAHEHGVGQLNIAFDGAKIAMELEAPGADIVGFEYAAKSVEDRAAIDEAVATLAKPLDLFSVPVSAGCSVTQASVEHETHAGVGDHDDHAETHDDHADEHGHDDHAEAHDDHEDEAGHTEFHAQYELTCADTSKVNEINFAYFDTFSNAMEVVVQVISGTGATSFEVEREAPTLDLRETF
ncbi:DUF2796 domain-containing protein [Rhodobacteraceae bacterium]|nr:DUF2796 domain-containing protein [Paracoccaceae bacterium]